MAFHPFRLAPASFRDAALRLRFTSAFVRLRRDKSARQGRLRLRPRRAAFGRRQFENRFQFSFVIDLAGFRWRIGIPFAYESYRHQWESAEGREH